MIKIDLRSNKALSAVMHHTYIDYDAKWKAPTAVLGKQIHQTDITDLMTNLLHLSARLGLSPSEISEISYDNYLEETRDDNL